MGNWEQREYLTLKPEKLKWTPFLLSLADMATLKPTVTSSLASAVADIVVDDTVKGPVADADVLGSNSSQREASEAATAKRAEEQINDLPSKPELDLDLDMPQAAPIPRPPSPVASPTPVQVSPARARNMLDELADVAILTDVRSRPPVVEKMLSSKLSSSISSSSAQTDHGKDIAAATEESQSSSQSLTPSTPMSPSRSSINGRPSSRRKLRSQPSPNVVIFTSPNRESQFPKVLENATPKFNGEDTRDLKFQKEQPLPSIPRRQSPSHLSVDTQMLNAPKELPREPNGVTPTYSAKKRRKPDSPLSSPTVTLSPDRPTTRRQAQAIAEETARSSRQTRSKASRVTAAISNGFSSIRVSHTDTRVSSRVNGSVTTYPKPSRSRRGDGEDDVMEDTAGGSAISEGSGSDIPMASAGDPMESVEEILTANGVGSNIVNGHDGSILPAIVESALCNGSGSQLSVIGEIDCLETDSPNQEKDVNYVPPMSSSVGAVEETLFEGDDLDADGETDPDIDGETDRDAEGESDPDAVM